MIKNCCKSWLWKIVLWWTLGCMYLLEIRFSPGICTREVLLGHMVILFYFYLFIFYFTILYSFYHISTWIRHGCTCVPYLEPPPTSLLIPSLWVIPVHQPLVSCIMHWTLPGASTGVLTHDKGGNWYTERTWHEKVSQDSRAPWICLSIYPQTRICLLYYFTTFTNSSDINGGLSLTTFLWRKST